MSSQSESSPPKTGPQPTELSVSDFLPDWMIRLGWVFDVGFQCLENKRPAGWMPAMLVFCSLALILLLGTALRLPLAVPLGIVGALDLLVTRHFVGLGCRRLKRLGFMGPTRACWWFEVAALVWTLLMSCGCFIAVHHKAALVGGWQAGLIEVAFTSTKCLLPAFIVLAVTGYFIGLMRGKRLSGRALELVNFFFWAIVGCEAAMWLVPQQPVLGNRVAAGAGIVGAGILLLALALEARRRFRTAAPTDDIDPSREPRMAEVASRHQKYPRQESDLRPSV